MNCWPLWMPRWHSYSPAKELQRLNTVQPLRYDLQTPCSPVCGLPNDGKVAGNSAVHAE
jgi:hypothetical protein